MSTTLRITVTDATEEQHSAVIQALCDAGLPPRQWSVSFGVSLSKGERKP